MNEVLVSVIIPVYNSGEYLDDAINSILKQTFERFELILVDDGSTDGSSKKCDDFQKKDPRIVVLHQQNKGICSARNEALKMAKGEYIAFSDHDDVCKEDMLYDNYLMAKEKNLDFVKFCREEYRINSQGKIESYSLNKAETNFYGSKDIPSVFYELYDRRLFACVWDGLYKRDFLTRNNILFDPKYRSGGEDYMFLISCLKYVNRWGINGKCYYTHFLRKDFSTSSRLDYSRDVVLKDVIKNSVDMLRFHDVTPEDNPSQFSHFYIREYIVGYLTFLARKGLSLNEFKEQLSLLYSESRYFEIIKKSHLPWMKDFYYNIIRVLYVHRCDFLLYSLFYLKTPK